MTRVYKYVRTHVHTSIAARSFVYLSRRSCVNASRRLHLIFSPTILFLFSLSSSHSCVCGHRLTPHISVTVLLSFSTVVVFSPPLALELTLFVTLYLLIFPRYSSSFTLLSSSLSLSHSFVLQIYIIPHLLSSFGIIYP